MSHKVLGIKNKICIVSTYPPEVGGVSTYTENLLKAMDLSNFQVVVLAEKTGKPYPVTGNLKVVGCWETGLLYPFQIFKTLCRYRPKLVHVQHEYFIFGGMVSAAFFPILIFLSRFLRVKFIVTLHGIVNPVEITDPELGSIGNENLRGLPRSLSQIGMLLITRLITDNSHKIVVMNASHRHILMNAYRVSAKKIVTIPHGIPQSQPIGQDEAKRQLGFDGLKVILYFGYITKYKGIDILVKAFREIDFQKAILVLGGSLHPRLKNNNSYKEFWDSIMAEIVKDPRIKFVGFIPEGNLTTYISASDVVVFPYVASFSTGGPMNITLGHRKPVIASRISSFSDILPSYAIFKTGSVADLKRVLSKVLSDDDLRAELAQSTKKIADERSWSQVAKTTVDLYYVLMKKQKS